MHRLLPATATALAMLATPAAAHLPHGTYGSLMAGFSHPLFGLDHVLAMLAVGLWASLVSGRAVWTLPASFVGVMVAGFALAVAGAPLPMVEPVILASTIVLGVAVAAAFRPGPATCVALVAAFGLFHGHAHGAELGGAGALRFGLGFALATAALHATGVGLGLAAARFGSRLFVRGLGLLTAMGGLALTVG